MPERLIGPGHPAEVQDFRLPLLRPTQAKRQCRWRGAQPRPTLLSHRRRCLICSLPHKQPKQMAAVGAQAADCLVFVDFQVTAGGGEAEIIEFPFVTFDRSIGDIVDRRRIVVKPATPGVSAPPDSDITEDMLQAAGPLQAAIAEFNKYSFTSFVSENKDFLIVTKNANTMSQLVEECGRKGLKLAAHYRQFANLAADFRAHYKPGSAGLGSIAKMLNHIGKAKDDQRESGMGACEGMATIALEMHADGASFGLNPDLTVAAVSTGATAAPSADNKASVPKSCLPGGRFVVRLRGLPFSAREPDVRAFIAPLVLPESGAIHFTLDRRGRASGECMMQFETKEDALACLDKHKESMGTRYIEVLKSSKVELQAALALAPTASPAARGGRGGGSDSAAPSEEDYTDKTPCVRLRGLPFSAGIAEIQAFLSGIDGIDYKLPNPDTSGGGGDGGAAAAEAEADPGARFSGGGMTLMIGGDGRKTGEAWVAFESTEAAQLCVDVKNKQSMGTRYIELFLTTKGELLRIQESRRAGGVGGFPLAGGGGGSGDGGGSYNGTGAVEEDAVVRLRGIPFTATLQDIQHFFTPTAAPPLAAAAVAGGAGGEGEEGKTGAEGGDAAAEGERETVPFELCERGVHFVPPRDGSGRPSGEAYVEFTTVRYLSTACLLQLGHM